MAKVVVAIRDVKADCYQHAHFTVSEGVAIRELSDAVADERTAVHAHPEDYQLFVVGEFDEQTGVLTGLDQPKFLISAASCVALIKKED